MNADADRDATPEGSAVTEPAGRRGSLRGRGRNARVRERNEPGRERTGLIEMVRKANQPLPPENSVLFRLSTLVAVLAGVIGCAYVGEISLTVALIASVGIGA